MSMVKMLSVKLSMKFILSFIFIEWNPKQLSGRSLVLNLRCKWGKFVITSRLQQTVPRHWVDVKPISNSDCNASFNGCVSGYRCSHASSQLANCRSHEIHYWTQYKFSQVVMSVLKLYYIICSVVLKCYFLEVTRSI